MLDDLVMTRTEGEKLRDLFVLKFRQINDLQDWKDYLSGIEGVEYVGKFSEHYSDPLDHLLESINVRPGERFVIRDPQNRNNFVLVEKELAQKILVLGALP